MTEITLPQHGVGNANSSTPALKKSDGHTVAGKLVPTPLAANDKAGNTKSTTEQVTSSIKTIQDFVNVQGYNLQFSTDKKSGAMVVKVMDSKTHDVIRQIPAEEVLKIAERVKQLRDELGKKIGILFDNNA